jgi:hypothetical protein
VKCWGANDRGQVGDGSGLDRHTPALVSGLSGVASIGIGGQHSCARLSGATLRCWGDNSGGQLGDGTLTTRYSPVAVTGLSEVSAVDASGDTCALLADATAKCWGINLFGELGDGTVVPRLHPVSVAGIGALHGGPHTVCVRATDPAGHASDGAACTGLVAEAPTAQLTAPASPTRATTLTWTLTFGGPITDLSSSDLTRTGTAARCVIAAPSGAGADWTVAVAGCGSGTVALALKAASVRDAAGNRGPIAAATASSVLVDLVRPTTTTPTVTPRAGTTLSGTAIPVTVKTAGADSGGSGIGRYELAKSTDGGASWATISTTLTSPSHAMTVAASGTIRFRFRAVDKAGNVGLWATGPVLTPRLIQQTSTSIRYAGSWATGSATAYSGGSVKSASASTATATYTFTGRSIALVTTRSLARGKVRVYVNGSLVATVDCGGPTAYRSVLWQRTWSTSASRTVKLVVAGTAGRPRFDLDAFAVLR